MCPKVVGTVWDGFLLPKGVSSACTRHCPRNTEVTTPQQLILAMTLPWIWVLGQGWAQRALFFQCLSLAQERAPREMAAPGAAQQAGIQDRRCE